MSGVHSDLTGLSRLIPRTSLSRRNLRLVRAGSRLAPPIRGVEVLTLPTGARLRLHHPPRPANPTPALLWLHGGGYVLGTARQDDRLCRRLAALLGATVAALDYRLAPRHPYPAALDDGAAALTRLAATPTVDPARMAVGGASAGGGLAAALALRARDDATLPDPVLQVLSYPVLDDRSAGLPPNRRYRLWTPAANRFAWACYLGDADPAVAVPARREDLRGVAPAWIGVGTHDLFHGECLAYADRLISAGVACQLEVVPGAFHGFDLLAPWKTVSQNYFASQCRALHAAFATGS